jgi:hypothetical protein
VLRPMQKQRIIEIIWFGSGGSKRNCHILAVEKVLPLPSVVFGALELGLMNFTNVVTNELMGLSEIRAPALLAAWQILL